ncbi:Uncharacterised protein [Mycobacterium tuberculosis]|nr:Uncharacterised protein [Mycobacterium tuberculosis]
MRVSVPSRGFGSVSVPSRGFGSDDCCTSRTRCDSASSFRPLSGFWVVSVPSRGFGSDDRPVAARLPPPLLTWFPSPLGVLGLFPSPLGVLGLTTLARTTHPPSTGRFRPLSGFWVVSVPSRGFGSDDYLIEAGKLRAVRFPSPLGVLGLFPSPLGVLGLTTGHWTCMRHRWRTSFRPLSGFWVVSVPSRGFGSEDMEQ